jgi:hypothetical protein
MAKEKPSSTQAREMEFGLSSGMEGRKAWTIILPSHVQITSLPYTVSARPLWFLKIEEWKLGAMNTELVREILAAWMKCLHANEPKTIYRNLQERLINR